MTVLKITPIPCENLILDVRVTLHVDYGDLVIQLDRKHKSYFGAVKLSGSMIRAIVEAMERHDKFLAEEALKAL